MTEAPTHVRDINGRPIQAGDTVCYLGGVPPHISSLIEGIASHDGHHETLNKACLWVRMPDARLLPFFEGTPSFLYSQAGPLSPEARAAVSEVLHAQLDAQKRIHVDMLQEIPDA